MQSIVNIEELLRQIFNHLGSHDGPQLAMTCRNFLEPALDLTWSTLDGGTLAPLLDLLPHVCISLIYLFPV